MKIAVCLSGELRNYQDTFPYFKKFIMDKLNPDIFICTNKNEEFLKNYNPKTIAIQEGTINRPHNYRTFHPSTNNISLLNQHYKIEKCNQLKIEYENKNDFKYDLVMRCRLDCFFNNWFSDKELQPNKNEVIVPWGWDFKGVSPNAETDIFALGESNTMDLYSNSYSNIDSYKNEVIYHSESVMGYNLFKQGIRVRTYPINFMFDFPEYDINGNKHIVTDAMLVNGNNYTNKPYRGKNHYYPSTKFKK